MFPESLVVLRVDGEVVGRLGVIDGLEHPEQSSPREEAEHEAEKRSSCGVEVNHYRSV